MSKVEPKIVNGIDVYICQTEEDKYVCIDNILTTKYPIVDLKDSSILTTNSDSQSSKCIWCQTDLDEVHRSVYYIQANHPTPKKEIGACCKYCFTDLEKFAERVTKPKITSKLL